MRLFEHETDNGRRLMVDDTFAAGGLSFQILQPGTMLRIVLSPEAAAELLEALRANVPLEVLHEQTDAKQFPPETRIVVGDVEITDSTGRPMYELAAAARGVIQEMHRSGTAEVAEARLEKINDLQAELEAARGEIAQLDGMIAAGRGKLDVAREALRIARAQYVASEDGSLWSGYVGAETSMGMIMQLDKALTDSSW